MRRAVLLVACLSSWPAVARPAEAPAATPAAGQTLAFRGIRLYYETAGQGPPLLLLHGGAGNGMQFEKQRDEFARSHTVIIPDCRAQGRSTDRPGPLTFHDMAEDMVALLNRLGVGPVDIMGWSDGGNIGLDLAIHHPKRVSHLVTFGANFAPDGLQAADQAWNRTATADSFGTGMRDGWTALSPDPAHYEAAMTKILDLWRTQPRFTAAELGRIRARTLICVGEHDVIRPEHTAELVRRIPGAETWTVPGASHSAMIERPDLVNPRVLAFLATKGMARGTTKGTTKSRRSGAKAVDRSAPASIVH